MKCPDCKNWQHLFTFPQHEEGNEYYCHVCGKFWKFSELVQRINDRCDSILSSPLEIEEQP